MTQIYTQTKESFLEGLCCAEAVLLNVAKHNDIQSSHIPAMATGLCGGMGGAGHICGALSGGILALNLVLGRDNASGEVEDNNRAVRLLIERFETEFNSSSCRELIGCDFTTEDGRKKFVVEELFERCADFSGKAAELCHGVLAEIRAEQQK